MNWKSTLGAPLSPEETRRILDAWHGLKAASAAPCDLNPVQMLDWAAELRIQAWELTRAIDDAWFHANKRAAPKSRDNQLQEILDTLKESP